MGLAEVISLLMDFFTAVARIWGNYFMAKYQKIKLIHRTGRQMSLSCHSNMAHSTQIHQQKRKSYAQARDKRKSGTWRNNLLVSQQDCKNKKSSFVPSVIMTDLLHSFPEGFPQHWWMALISRQLQTLRMSRGSVQRCSQWHLAGLSGQDYGNSWTVPAASPITHPRGKFQLWKCVYLL